MPSERMIGAIIALVTVICTLAVLALIERAPSQTVQCADSGTREEMRSLALQGVNDAFREQTTHLFQIWMKDPAGQPKRATVGMQVNVSAYFRAKALVLSWNPPVC